MPHNHKTLNAINGIILYDFALFLKRCAYACVEAVVAKQVGASGNQSCAYACVEAVLAFVVAHSSELGCIYACVEAVPVLEIDKPISQVAPMNVWKRCVYSSGILYNRCNHTDVKLMNLNPKEFVQ